MSSTRVATGAEAMTSSHIEEITEELTQLRGFEVPTTSMIPEGTTTMIREPLSQSSLPKDLSSSVLHLSKKIKISYILSLSLLLLIWLL